MSILLVAVFALPAVLYLAAWFRGHRFRVEPVAAVAAAGADAAVAALDAPGRAVGPGASPGGARRGGRPVNTLLVLAGLVLHAGAIAIAMTGAIERLPDGAPSSGLHYGFAQALSVTLWFGLVLLWLDGLRMRVEALQTVLLPAAAMAVLLPLFFPGANLSRLAGQPLFVPHLLMGTLAYGVLLLAALHAALMTAAARALHGAVGAQRSVFARWFDQLPPLMALERILFRFITAGFVLLTLTTLSGMVFSEQVFGRPMRIDHKTVFTLIAWVLFGVLLIGRARWGWRGRTALRLTLSGFVVLMLAYVGSHFVSEVILQRVPG
jgi:ABC-type uncharacterized transport system permease subunit